MRRICAMLVVFWLAAAAHGQIIVPDSVPANTPIVASLGVELPPGAKIEGGFESPTAKWIAVDATTIHIWAAPGTHKLAFRGAWIQTKDVTLPDGETIQALLGFGFLSDSVEFTVEGKQGPDPPPPPPQELVGVIVEETTERTTDQARLWHEIRRAFPAEFGKLNILDKDQLVGPSWSSVSQAVRDSNLTLPVLVVTVPGGDRIIKVIPCPDTVAKIKEAINT